MRIVLLSIMVILFVLPEELEARRRSRGGGLFRKARKVRKAPRKPVRKAPSRSRARKIWKTGGKSSRGNVHEKHARKAGKKGTKFRSRSEAVNAYKKSKEFRKLPNTFKGKPKERPDYIPKTVVRENRSVNVIFVNNSYGYYHGSRFYPIDHNDYYVNDYRLHGSYGYRHRTQHSSSGGILLLFCMILFIAFVVFLIYIFIQANKKKANPQANVIGEPEPEPESETPHTDDPLLKKLYGKKEGDLINLSDPDTLTEFGKAVDFTVTKVNSYTHDTFNLVEIALLNDVDGKESIQNHFFIKEVDGDYALYMGMLDHEGNNESLEEEQWFHLDESGDQFLEEFHSVLADKDGQDIEVTFGQLGIGPFYDVEFGDGEPVAICEYQPEDDCDWQYAIVIWQGDWISCFYCNEIHEHNFDAF